MLKCGTMAIVAFVTPVAQGIIDVIGHFVTGVGDEILSFLAVAFADKKERNTCGEGSSKGGERDSLRSLHCSNFVK
jgi:hypothetical protein